MAAVGESVRQEFARRIKLITEKMKASTDKEIKDTGISIEKTLLGNNNFLTEKSEGRLKQGKVNTISFISKLLKTPDTSDLAEQVKEKIEFKAELIGIIEDITPKAITSMKIVQTASYSKSRW